MHKVFSFLRSTKGQSLTEFALILPFLLLLIGGVIDFGLSFFIGQVIENAAREGARVGAVVRPSPGTTTFPATDATSSGLSCQFNSDCSSATSQVLVAANSRLSSVGSSLFNGFTITSRYIAASGASANDAGVQVTISGNYNWFLISGLLNSTLPLVGQGSGWNGSITIARTATMRWEWQ